jgi:hypothetical protein
LYSNAKFFKDLSLKVEDQYPFRENVYWMKITPKKETTKPPTKEKDKFRHKKLKKCACNFF